MVITMSGYSDFKKLDDVKKNLGLKIQECHDLFETLAANIKPGDSLREFLSDNIELAIAIDTEKAKSEFIVAPILAEVRKILKKQISLFSGIEFEVEPEKSLTGRCDFLISRSSEQLVVVAPVVVIVEAKDDNIKSGLAQCIATMFAAQIFNDREKRPLKAIYGSVTTGQLWQFLKLEGDTVAIGLKLYHVEDIETLLGILVHIVSA
jgi:hypothetical protein